MPWSIKESDIVGLAHEAGKLLNLDIDELYAVLGLQLLASASPTRGAGVLAQILALKTASATRAMNPAPGSEFAEDAWVADLYAICSGLEGDGREFVEAAREEFRKGLCNETVLRLTEDVDEAKMQILIMIISAILKLPPAFESISATLAAMLCKSQLREICC
jgi:hypothetical protein